MNPATSSVCRLRRTFAGQSRKQHLKLVDGHEALFLSEVVKHTAQLVLNLIQALKKIGGRQK